MFNIAPRPARELTNVATVKPPEKEPSREPVPRKNVTVACQVCRARRTKCDGVRPTCSRCVRTDTECVYAQDLDGRTTAGIKRKYHEIKQDQDLLDGLLLSIRDGSEDQVSQIISLIRSSAPLQDVKAAISLQLVKLRNEGRDPSSELDKITSEASGVEDGGSSRTPAGSRRDILQIHRLADSPLYQASPHPWTSVTQDTDLVSNLLSVWLTWDKPWNNWMDHHLFLRDMQRGRSNATYCSSFLVNCILAWACPYSDWSEARTRRGAVSELMAAFIGEAKGQLESDMMKGPSLPIVQGLMFLFLALSLCGQDRLGFPYMMQAIELSQELARLPPSRLVVDDQDDTTELVHAVDLTCWGVFNTTTAAQITLMRPQMMRVPTRPIPTVVLQSRQQETWSPYPRSQQAVPSLAQEIMALHCRIAVFEAELSRLLFDAHNDQVEYPRRKLEADILTLVGEIDSALTEATEYVKLTTQSSACVYTHRVWSQVVGLNAFLFLRQPVHGATEAVRKTAEHKCIETALEIARVCRLYTDQYGPAFFHNVFTYATSMALYALIESPDTSSWHAPLIDLCVCLRALSRRWPISMAVLRMVQLDARNSGVALPSEADKLLQDFVNTDWHDREMKPLVSVYPHPDRAAFRTTEVIDIHNFVEELDIGEQSILQIRQHRPSFRRKDSM